jgi:diguanylate cyclase (GGDEF)-like protein
MSEHDDKTDSTVILDGNLNIDEKQEEMKAATPEDGGSLILIQGDPQGQRYIIDSPKMVIGRDEQADVVIKEGGVSRKHAQILHTPKSLVVQDLDSTNGTFVNEKRITQTLLKKDDMIRVGKALLKYLPPGSVELGYHRRLMDAAHTDPLTGVNNKRYIMEALEMEFQRAKQQKGELSLIVVDLDHFKDINDNFGHDAGDYILKQATRVFRENGIRVSDILGRYGGEEFIAILPDTGLKPALEVAERIRSSLEAFPFVYDDTSIKVTASCGVASVDDSVQNSLALFKLADRATYDAKNAGRNRTASR